MATFKDFVDENLQFSEESERRNPLGISLDKNNLPAFTPRNITSLVSTVFEAAALRNIGKPEQNDLAAHLADVVSSDAFISELSSTLGDPKPGESENEFVARARMAFRGIMHQRLKKR